MTAPTGVARELRRIRLRRKLLALAVMLGATAALVGAWGLVVMLLAGALGHVFDVEWLSLGYWQALVVALALSVVGQLLRT